jgi:hypothetical protein
MWVPCFTHIFSVAIKVNSSNAAIRDKEVANHVSCSYVRESNHVIINSFKVHWIKCRDNFFNACSTAVQVLKMLTA